MRTIEECSRVFVDALLDSERRRPFDIRDEDTWLDGAIVASQGQGNPQGSRLTLPNPLKQQIDQRLRQWRSLAADKNLIGYHQFEKITSESFDVMHSTVEVLDSECLLLFGRVQKIHNIWLKYQIALYYSGYLPNYTAANPGIGKLLQLAHVPIDNIVLTHMFDHNLASPAVTNIGVVRLDWKLKLQKPRYMTLQDHLLKAALAAGYDSALHYEMDLIWVP
jgi:hypothetical protein